jgi:hypothetical protein
MDTRLRALAVVVGLSLMSVPVLAASPQVQAAVKAIQTVGTDAQRLKTYCELVNIEEENAEKAVPSVQVRMDKLLDELGADFKAAWAIAQTIDPASEDGKVLLAALDQLSDKCSD